MVKKEKLEDHAPFFSSTSNLPSNKNNDRNGEYYNIKIKRENEDDSHHTTHNNSDDINNSNSNNNNNVDSSTNASPLLLHRSGRTITVHKREIKTNNDSDPPAKRVNHGVNDRKAAFLRECELLAQKEEWKGERLFRKLDKASVASLPPLEFAGFDFFAYF